MGTAIVTLKRAKDGHLKLEEPGFLITKLIQLWEIMRTAGMSLSVILTDIRWAVGL